MRWSAVVIATLWTSARALAGGDGADPTFDKPAAEKLFDEGRADLAAGRADAACAKFELSIEKDPRAVGTLLNIGLCNERLGKVATALARFVESYDRATEANQPELRKAAEEHIVTLRPQVPVVALAYDAPAIPNEKLLVDDHVVTRAQHELPIDPGPHSVVFTAPGRLPYETTIIAKAATRIRLQIPALETPSHTNTTRLVAKVTTFSGLGVSVAALGLGLLARHDYHAQFQGSMPHCGGNPDIDGKPSCDATGQVATDDARRLAQTSVIIGGVGLAAAAVGITLWVLAPSEHIRIVPTGSSSDAGLAVVGRF